MDRSGEGRAWRWLPVRQDGGQRRRGEECYYGLVCPLHLCSVFLVGGGGIAGGGTCLYHVNVEEK